MNVREGFIRTRLEKEMIKTEQDTASQLKLGQQISEIDEDF